jgi:hypothetical protein
MKIEPDLSPRRKSSNAKDTLNPNKSALITISKTVITSLKFGILKAAFKIVQEP